MPRAISAWATVLIAVAAAALGCSDDPVSPEPPVEPAPWFDRTMDWYPSWSQDGRLVVYSHFGLDEQPFGIYALRFDEDFALLGGPEFLLEVGNGLNWATWLDLSPDGNRIAYWLSGEIWVFDLRSGENAQVTFLQPDNQGHHPNWHPYENVIVYNRTREDPADPGGIRTIDLTTLEDRPILRAGGLPTYGGQARWAPDGKSIVLVKSGPGGHGSEIYRVIPNESDYIQLTSTRWLKEQPLWINGGTEIAYMRSFTTERPRTTWYVMSPDGSNQRPLLHDGMEVYLGELLLSLNPAGTMAIAPMPDVWNRLNMLWLVRWDEPGAIREVQLTYPVCPVRLVEEFEGCESGG